MSKEQWKPLLETEIQKIYVKKDKNLIISNRGFTLQDDKTIIKRPMNKEFEPKIENKLPRCANPDCKKVVDITDPNKGYIKSGDDYFHLNHFKLKDRTSEEIIFRSLKKLST